MNIEDVRGVVVVGYQGIGKSTLANKSKKFVDLESSNFWIGNYRWDNWYIPYCNIAVNLAKQGYVVFVSSHQDVRDYLNSMYDVLEGVKIASCVPTLSLKDKWIQKLHQRYMNTQTQKDYKAWKNAEDRYNDNIIEISRSFKTVCLIADMNYSLEDLLYYTFHNAGWRINI